MKYSVYVFLSGCFWGMISIFVDYLCGAGFSSMQCVALRSVITTAVLFIYLLVTDRRALKIELRDIPVFLGTGIVSIVFFNFCYFNCIELAGGAAVPALLMYTAPVFVIIFSAIFYKEKITSRKVIAVIIMLAGLAIVTGAFTGNETISAATLLYGIGAGLGYSMYSIFSKRVIGKYGPITIIFYTFLVGTCFAVPVSGVMSNLTPLLEPKTIFYVLGLVLLCTIAPYMLYTKGLSGIEAGKASILSSIEPVVAAIVGVIFFNEKFPPSKIIGMLLVLFAIVFLNFGKTSTKDTERRPAVTEENKQ